MILISLQSLLPHPSGPCFKTVLFSSDPVFPRYKLVTWHRNTETNLSFEAEMLSTFIVWILKAAEWTVWCAGCAIFYINWGEVIRCGGTLLSLSVAVHDPSTFTYIFMQGREKRETEWCHTRSLPRCWVALASRRFNPFRSLDPIHPLQHFHVGLVSCVIALYYYKAV